MNTGSSAHVLIVTGMHRSGTSLAASCFAKAGVNMGERLLPGDANNRPGYFEDISFLELQRQMLRSALPPGAPGWPDWGWADGGVPNEEVYESYCGKATDLVEERSRKCKVWGWKDPRTSLLLEFWHRVAPEAKYVFVFREPWEVEDSIRRLGAPVFDRNPGYALKIWQDYNSALLKFLKDQRERCILVPLYIVCNSPDDLVDYATRKFALPLSPAPRLEGLYEPALLRQKAVDPIFLREFAARNVAEWHTWLELNDLAERELVLKGGRNPAQATVQAVYSVPQAPVWSASPRVSIVVPCYNMGLYLLDALESAAACDPQLCEVIVVDDGSTDPQTKETIKRIKERKWRVIQQDHSGLPDARNTGIRAAAGDLVLPLDADNRIVPDYVARSIEVLDSEPAAGVVYGDFEFFGERHGRQSVSDFDLDLLRLGNYVDACAVFRKTVWEQAGGFDARMPFSGHEDWDLWLTAAELGWEFRHLPEVLFYYRVRPNSMLKECSRPESYRATVEYLAQKHPSFRDTYHRVIGRLNEILLKTREQANESESYARSLARTLQMRQAELARTDQELKLQRERTERAEGYARSLETHLKALEVEVTSSRSALELSRQQFLEAERYAQSLKEHLDARQRALEGALAEVETNRQQFRTAELYALSLKSHPDFRQHRPKTVPSQNEPEAVKAVAHQPEKRGRWSSLKRIVARSFFSRSFGRGEK